ncbi:GNAT family N-acetyltransferase [Novosphingobium gossypii]|uniref:GNAT family N-acetyltransferase n=1 Tax=Novosphingobium gossypii TaxID=1604774 RepID=UPI003D1B5418
MFVRTERLFLRPAWPEDFDEIVEALEGDGLQCSTDILPVARKADDLRVYLDRPRDPRLPLFFMYLRAPGGAQLVGSIGLARHEGDVEVDYWIASRHRGYGFAAEALRAVMRHARALGHVRVVASDFADDANTHLTLESAGFRDTGQVRSRYVATRAMEYAARIYVADLKRRVAPATPGMMQVVGVA